MPSRPNVVFLLADQLRASSLPVYGEKQIETPHIDRLAGEGTVFTNMVSTCPVCTPYRSMLLTGRHPQTTGHLLNFMTTRHDEIGVGDAFTAAGYRTGWIGKWHLHRGSFPQVEGQDFVPEGRDRLGFQYWRGYNFHCQYNNGWANVGDWRNERWQGYETHALNGYAYEFMDQAGDDPFCLFISPHQPHYTGVSPFAPQECYDRVPERLVLPDNVPDSMRPQSEEMYRHYLAMTVALDDMVGDLIAYLDRTGLAQNTILAFTSDHGTQVGAHGIRPWQKMRPYGESLNVPLIIRWPGVLGAGETLDVLTAPVDLFPTLCGLCGIPVPRTVEGYDLADSWRRVHGAFEQEAVLTMNFSATYDWLLDGKEWRGVRTKEHSYTRWLDGTVEMHDLLNDPLQMRNLALDRAAGHDGSADQIEGLETYLAHLLARRHDSLVPCHTYIDWFDAQRRVVRNAYGPLGNPEGVPDWSLLV